MHNLLEPQNAEENYVTVSGFIDSLNNSLRRQNTRILGEVSQLQMYPGRNYLFFTLKDSESEAMIKCIMWKTQYDVSGVDLEDGMEIIVSGYPEVYAPSGNLTLKAQSVELVGEGALKKAYDKLKAQLEKEGLFSDVKKRPIPSFAQKIGIITSRDGAVINDFLSNIGRHGYKLSLIHSRVEGQLATEELLHSVRTFKKRDIDVLVIIRGGGSLESLLPFNNEALVREIASFPVPVIAGIGHDKDITLVAMAADKMVSTPTAVTTLLNDSWNKALGYIELAESKIVSRYKDALLRENSKVDALFSNIKESFRDILSGFSEPEYKLKEKLRDIQHHLDTFTREIVRFQTHIMQQFAHHYREVEKVADSLLLNSLRILKVEIDKKAQDIEFFNKQLSIYNPERQLKLGYSILLNKGKVLKSVQDIEKGDIIHVRMQDGTVESEVKNINHI